MDRLEKVPFAVTVTDSEGYILEMNERSRQTYIKHGNIIGQSIFDCHPERARQILTRLFQTHEVNAYTIEKEGIHKLIYQTPWFKEDGTFGGYMEISLPIPADMPHYVRQPK